jgi:hypothetical protein
MLKSFDDAAAELRSFLRAGHPLSEAEQLFIENRLMMLRMEYTIWAKDKLKEAHRASGAGELKDAPEQDPRHQDA